MLSKVAKLALKMVFKLKRFSHKSLASPDIRAVVWGKRAHRGTSLIRNSAPPGTCSRTMPRLLWRSLGGGRRCLMSEVSLYPTQKTVPTLARLCGPPWSRLTGFWWGCRIARWGPRIRGPRQTRLRGPRLTRTPKGRPSGLPLRGPPLRGPPFLLFGFLLLRGLRGIPASGLGVRV